MPAAAFPEHGAERLFRHGWQHAGLWGLILLVGTVLAVGCETVEERHKNSRRAETILLSAVAAGTLTAMNPQDSVPVFEGGVAGLRVKRRTNTLTRFPCSQCHGISLAQLKVQAAPDKRNGHWEIQLAHAPPDTLTCATCHADAAQMGALKLLSGNQVQIDHSYRVCGQCHSGKARDWRGGAHGKRTSGWAQTRVVENCASCHDPHQPGRPVLVPRWPAIVPMKVGK